MAFPNNAYWGQVDLWFSKDVQLLRRADKLVRSSKSGFRSLN